MSHPPRFLALYLPDLVLHIASQARTLSDQNSAHLLAYRNTDTHQPKIWACTPAARHAGVQVGTSLELAKALCAHSNPAIIAVAPRTVRTVLLGIARWCLQFGPTVGVDPQARAFLAGDDFSLAPEHLGVLIDITGTERYHRGLSALALRVVHALMPWQMAVRVAIAPTIAAAWGLARYAEQPVSIVEGFPHPAIRTLPVASLQLPREINDNLRALGVSTVGELLSLPSRSLRKRFNGMVSAALEELLGTTQVALVPLTFAHSLLSVHRFEVPITNTLLLAQAATHIIQRGIARLQEQRKKARTFRFIFEYVLPPERTRQQISKDISLHAPTAEAEHVISVIIPTVERLITYEGVVSIELHGLLLEEQLPSAISLFEEPSRSAESSQLLTTLTSLVGHQGVRQVVLRPSFIPERSFGYLPSSASGAANALPYDQLQTRPQLNLPPQLFEKPEPIAAVALLPDHPPSQISWHGQVRKVVIGRGPEKIGVEWWRTNGSISEATAQEREYFTIQDEDGRWLWVFKNKRTLEWFAHGMWV